MSESLPTRPAPLAWDRDGRLFQVPPGSIGWHVKKVTGGRPRVVFDENHLPVLLDMGAHMGDLRAVVPGPGHYRLVPVDAEHNELSPIAHIEVMPEGELEPLSPPGVYESGHRQDRMYELVERLITNRESHDVLTADLLKTLVTTTATIQQSTAALLQTANTTIRVANGVEALERHAPQIDVDELGAQLSEALAPAGKTGSETPWFLQLMQGPVGATLMNLIAGFAQGMAAQAAPQAGAAAPTRPPTASRPPRQAPPVDDVQEEIEDEHEADEDEQEDIEDEGTDEEDTKAEQGVKNTKNEQTEEQAAEEAGEDAEAESKAAERDRAIECDESCSEHSEVESEIIAALLEADTPTARDMESGERPSSAMSDAPASANAAGPVLGPIQPPSIMTDDAPAPISATGTKFLPCGMSSPPPGTGRARPCPAPTRKKRRKKRRKQRQRKQRRRKRS